MRALWRAIRLLQMTSFRIVSSALSGKFTCGKKAPISAPGCSPSCITDISATRRTARQRDIVQLQKWKPGSAASPNQIVRLELRDLERAIARLPEEQRSVILLVGLEGMRYDEVALVLNLPVGTVRSRVFRGRASLRVMTGLLPGQHSPPLEHAAKRAARRRRAPVGNCHPPI